MNNNLNDGNTAYDGQNITFRCTVRGVGRFLTWSSNEYIGLGQELQLHRHGQTEYAEFSNTVATLISTTTDDDTQVTEIVSDLNITVSLQYPSISSVICQLNSHGTSKQTEFRKADTSNTC